MTGFAVTADHTAYTVEGDLRPLAMEVGAIVPSETGLPPLLDNLELYVNATYPTGF